LLTGGGVQSTSSSREQEKKERRRRRRRREEEQEEEEKERQRQLRKPKTTTTTMTSPPRAPSPSLLAPCPVCGALFRRGLELDAHVAQEVVAGLSDEDDDEVKETTTRSNREVAPLPPPRVLLPNARAPASTSTSSVFELSDARAEVALFKKSTREAAAEVRIQQQQQENQNRNQQAKRPPLAPAPPKVLRLPRMEQRFNHFADGAGAWGDETLGIDGASGAQAWQARGVSGIGDPFRGASGGAAGE